MNPDVAHDWTMHKFGGSSLADASCFRRVADILVAARQAHAEAPVGVVVSAMGGMTDRLLGVAQLAETDAPSARRAVAELGERYSTAVTELLSRESQIAALDAWGKDSEALIEQLESIAQEGFASATHRDRVAAYGELWSARLLAYALGEQLEQGGGAWLDARDVLVVRHGELGPQVLWEQAQRNFARRFESFDGVVVITGFVAMDERGDATTLGRNGSDYSAAIFAKLAAARELTIWTDVDGVLSGDPRRVPEAQVIGELSYNEAMELAYFGAKVLHPQTMGPVVDRTIPVNIRNTFAPHLPGSRITARSLDDAGIKGVTSIDDVAIVNVEGSGMIGVPGTADRLFAALKEADVSVTLISQASSEHSICLAVPRTLAERARRVISEAFAGELDAGQIQRVDVTDEQSIVAVVGDNMAGLPGVAGRFFGTLGSAGINVRAIAQGSSERNISAVVDTVDSTRALRAVHSGFYLSAKTLSIGLLGTGNVGGVLLEQLAQRAGLLRERFNLDLRVRAIARSQVQLLGQPRIDLADWRERLRNDAEPAPDAFDLTAFEAHIHPDHLPHALIIDCTSSDAIAARYSGWLERGIHVIAANKKAFSGDNDYYRELRASAERGGSHYFYETTVGAALPIISTLRDLLDTGDRVRSIEGILSGTLGYLFNVYDGERPFSEIVRDARESGYTEPDPRDDLSGMDVARKLTILAREMGLTIGVDDFPVENLVPEDLREVSTDEFLAGLPRHDDHMLDLYRTAERKGMVLRYVARLSEDEGLSVGLQQVAPDSPLGRAKLTDNVVRFSTDRYASNPLVVQGPGAGPAVTAGGVFADVLHLARRLGTSL